MTRGKCFSRLKKRFSNLWSRYSSSIQNIRFEWENVLKVLHQENALVRNRINGILKPELTTTCLQRPPFWGPIITLYSIKLPLNNDHLLTTATSIGSRGWSLYTGLTVFHFHYETIQLSSYWCKQTKQSRKETLSAYLQTSVMKWKKVKFYLFQLNWKVSCRPTFSLEGMWKLFLPLKWYPQDDR